MPYNVKEIIANKPSRFTAGHRMCAGCGAPPVARMVLRALNPEDHAVICRSDWLYGSFNIYIPIHSLDRFIYTYSI